MPIVTTETEEPILRKDLAQVVGSPTGGYLAVEVTQDADGVLRFYSNPGTGGVTDGDKGDITVTASGATWTIDAGVVTTAKIIDEAVTLAKMAPLATDRIIGRSTAGTGVPEAITCTAAGRALLDDASAAVQRSTLGLGSAAQSATGDFAASGDVTANGMTCADSRLLGRDDTGGGPDQVQEIRIASGLTLTGGELAVDVGAFAAASHTHAATEITIGTMATARLGSGTANATTYLRGDQTWATPTGGSVTIGAATITAPYDSLEYSETVAVGGVTAATSVVVSWGKHLDTDENLPEADGLRVQAVPGTGTITFTIFGDQPFGGPFKLHYITA